MSIQRQEGRIAIFSDFAEFVNAEAEEENSAFYKGIFSIGLSRRKCSSMKGNLKTFNTVASKRTAGVSKSTDKSITCPCYDRLHELASCKDFRTKSYVERKRFVRLQHLCFRCLKSEHCTEDCQSTRTCDKRSCRSNSHHTLLHVDPEEPAENPFPVCSLTDFKDPAQLQGKLGVCLDILPVRVSCGEVEVLTYALLDPSSFMSSCERGLIEALMLS